MRKRYALVPTVPDRLEARVALSSGMLAPALVSRAAVTTTPVPPTQVIDLRGTIKGIASPSPLASPIAGDLLLNGKGTVSPLGPAQLVGTLSIRSGEPTFYDGRVSLSNNLGSVQVHIFGLVGGPSGPPAHLHYEITGGSGLYRGAVGKGDVLYTQGPSASATGGPFAFSLAFGPSSTPTAAARPS